MKKTFLLFGLIFLLSAYIFAQTKPNFSGNWTLDKSKSKLDERMRIESITIKAAQTATDLIVDRVTKREGMDEGKPLPFVYKLDGNESTETIAGLPTTTKATITGDKLDLTLIRIAKSQNGEIKLIMKETWTLADGGETLKVVRTTTTPSGEQTIEMVFTKN